MALPGFRSNRKFRRLVMLLKMPEAHVLGHMQMIWESCYERADPDLGDAMDVELSAGWVGAPGELCAALMSCGGDGPGLIEVGTDGRHFVHDFWHHAPKYVSERAKKNEERMAAGETISSLRAKAGAAGAAKKWQNHTKKMAKDGKLPSGCQEKMANGWQVNGNLLPDQTSTVQYSTVIRENVSKQKNSSGKKNKPVNQKQTSIEEILVTDGTPDGDKLLDRFWRTAKLWEAGKNHKCRGAAIVYRSLYDKGVDLARIFKGACLYYDSFLAKNTKSHTDEHQYMTSFVEWLNQEGWESAIRSHAEEP